MQDSPSTPPTPPIRIHPKKEEEENVPELMPQPPKDVEFVSEKRIRKKDKKKKETGRQNHSTIVANNQTIRGNHNRIIGNNNVVEGNHNNLTGNNNRVKGRHNLATGNNNVLEGEHNNAFGNNNRFGENCTATSMVFPHFFGGDNLNGGFSNVQSHLHVGGRVHGSVNFNAGNVRIKDNKVYVNDRMIKAYPRGEINDVTYNNGKLCINGERVALD